MRGRGERGGRWGGGGHALESGYCRGLCVALWSVAAPLLHSPAFFRRFTSLLEGYRESNAGECLSSPSKSFLLVLQLVVRLATFPARCSPWTAASPTPMSSPFPSTSSVRITDSGSMVVRHTAPRDPRRPHLPGQATASADHSNASAGPSWKVIAAEITADVISAAILFWGAKLLYKWFDPAEAARAAEEKRQQEVRCGAVYGGCVWTCKQRVQW